MSSRTGARPRSKQPDLASASWERIGTDVVDSYEGVAQILVCEVNFHRYDAEQIAQLIVTAPKMLETLCRVERDLLVLQDSEGVDLRELVQAAIAEATGERPATKPVVRDHHARAVPAARGWSVRCPSCGLFGSFDLEADAIVVAGRHLEIGGFERPHGTDDTGKAHR